MSLPDVPTVKEADFADLEFSEWFGILLPAKAPIEIATFLNEAVRNARVQRRIDETVFGARRKFDE